MKHYIKNISVCIAAAILSAGCTEKFEEYNTNQYQIHDADPSTLMKTMVETIVNIQQNDSQMMDQMVGQYGGYFTCSNIWTGTNFGTFNQSDAWNANPWNTNFEKIYSNFFQVQEATGSSGHYYAFACMIRAINMLRVADCYGPMPYSQVKKGNFYVQYDDQETVYKNILNDFSNAADVLYGYYVDSNGNAPLGSNDPVFNGNYSNWAKLANSMKLRVAMRISSAFPDMARKAAEEAASHPAGMIETNSDNAMMNCGTQNNPYYIAAVTWGEIRANANIVDYMRGYNDPRMSKYFKYSTFTGKENEYVGMRSGEAGFEKNAVAAYSLPAVNGTDKLLVFCAAETSFLRAEGMLKGWNVGDKSEKYYYEEGINLSMEQHSVNIGSYLDNSLAPAVSHDNDPRGNDGSIKNTISVKWDESASDEEKLQRIITQKWIANYPLGLEAWADYRRTGYPELYPVIDNLSNCGVSSNRGARRLRFPYTEVQNNHSNYQKGVTYLNGADNEVTELVWAKKN